MWLVTTLGFFSVVQKSDDERNGTLTVRARVRADLDALRDTYVPSLGPIAVDAGTDYTYRAKAPRHEVACGLSSAVLDLDYANFKSAVSERQGAARAGVYHDLWSSLLRLNELDETAGPVKRSYGGVVMNNDRAVLLREPKGHFDGYVWTFPKGKQAAGETPEQTALRVVRELTGLACEIIGKLPGEFEGGTGVTEYFLMGSLREDEGFDRSKSDTVSWCPREGAPGFIGQTKNPIGRARDESVLTALDDYLRTHATRFSWALREMPAKRERIPFRMRFAPSEVARMKKGLVPRDQDQKWFIYFEGDTLHFHSSWSGFCLFEVRLAPDGACYRVSEAWANRSPDQCKSTDATEDAKGLTHLVEDWLQLGWHD